MMIQEKIAEILEIDLSKIKIYNNNKKDFEIQVFFDHLDKYRNIADVYDGNLMFMRIPYEDSEYKKIFEAADKSLYDSILKAYYENMAIIEKYKSLIDNKRKVVFYLKESYFYYNKRSKKLFVIPSIKVNTVSSMFQFQLPVSMLNKMENVVDSIHDQFFSQLLNVFLEKPLNHYTNDELILFHMTKI